MIKKFTFVVVIVSAIMAILLLSPIALGWFHDATISEADVKGSIIGSYFEYGDGTAEHPYGIAQPKQLYYLAWLQDLGYFNKTKNGKIEQYYFELSDMYGDTIDFTSIDVSYVIPPIGNQTYPFVGSFNGNGVTLANLTIDNQYGELSTVPADNHTPGYSEVASGVQIVGLFGVVGAIGANTTGATASINGATYATSVNEIKDFQIENITIKSIIPKDNYTVLGIVAGYVNGTISGVSVSNSTVSVGSGVTHLSTVEGTNPVVSDYGIAGYCEAPYKEALTITSVAANLPVETQNIIYKSTQSEGEGFGGSIKMTDLFNRLNTIVSSNTYSATARYTSAETVVYDEVTSTELSRTATATATPTDGWHSLSQNDGKYYVNSIGSDTSQKYLYLYQEQKTVTTITRNNQFESGYLISNGTLYLVLNNNHAISSSADGSNFNGWVLDSSGYLYTYTDDGYKYYLNVSTTPALTTATSGSTTWTKNNDNTLQCTVSGRTYYLTYDNEDEWTVFQAPNTFRIRSGNNNYLNRSGNAAFANTTNPGVTAEWVLDSDGYLYAFASNTNAQKYYLNGTSTLSVGTSKSTKWTLNETNGTLSYSYGGLTWYLRFKEGTWSVYPATDTITISSNGNYLNRNNDTSVTNGTSANSATEWIWDATNHKIYMVNNGNKLYLNATTTLNLASSSSTVWNLNETDHTISYSYDNKTWYLIYKNGIWMVYPDIPSYTIYDGSYYLSNTGTMLNAQTNVNDATYWFRDTSNGYFYTLYNGAYYYLNATTSLTLDSSASTSWTYNDSTKTLSYSYLSKTWYIFRNGTNWLVYPSNSVYTIAQGSTYLTIASTSNVGSTTTAGIATLWAFDNGAIYTVYSNNIYYLNATGNKVSVSTSNNTSWSFNNNRLSYNNSGTTMYLVYNNGWACSGTYQLSTIFSGENYLANNNATITNSTSVVKWFNNGDGKYFIIYNNTPYYLRGTNSSLSLTDTLTNATDFTYNSTDNSLSFTYSSNTYYVIYNDIQWTVSQVLKVDGPIHSGTGNYLNTNGTTITRGTSGTGATNWNYDSATGIISTQISGTTYYLRGYLEATQTVSTKNLAVTSDSSLATAWNYSGNNLSCSLTVDNQPVTYYVTLQDNTWKLMDTTKYYFTIADRSSNYMGTNSANSPSLTQASGQTTATLWNFSNTANNVDTEVSTIINGKTYYLSVPNTNNSNVTLSATSKTLYYQYYQSRYYIFSDYNSDYSIRYNGGWTTGNYYTGNGNRRVYYTVTRTQVTFSTASISIDGRTYSVTVNNENVENISMTQTNAASFTINEVSMSNASTLTITHRNYTALTFVNKKNGILTFTNKQVQVITRDNGVRQGSNEYYSAFPLNAEDTAPFSAKNSNTGYIVSGYSFKHGTDNHKHGDIRVSKYTKGVPSGSSSGTPANLQNAYNTSTISSMTDSRLEILTPRLNNGSVQWYRVSDSYNKNNNSVSSAISGYTKMTNTQLGLVRYEDARDALKEMLNGTYVYGLHFMDSTISVNNYVTLPNATIYGDNTLTNYQLPNDCIDFNVKRRGFVTVFAGTYFTGNSAFFSLHQIERDENNSLSSIKEIVEIYNPTGNSNDFIYKYSDGTYSSDKQRGSLAFKLEWMTNPSVFIDNAVYYFEIPVNGGEYALGSVPGKDGAYLFYLDIAANAGQAEDKDRRTITELFKTYEYDFELPKGVQLVESGESYDAAHPYETALVKFKDGYNGDSLLNIDDGVFEYNENTYTELSYLGGTLTSTSGSSSNTYYPKGYKIKRVENIIDIGRDTANPDIMRVEYIDSYNSSGSFTGRVVDIYAGVDVTDNEDELVKIISFTYNSTAGYDNTVMRCVRAASIGGFNIVFNQNVTITSTSITDEEVHVNFGSSTGSVLITAFKDQPLTNQSVTAVNMVYAENNIENAYVAPAYGDELLEYYYYKKSSATSTDKAIYFKAVDDTLSMTNKNGNLVLTPKLVYQTNAQTLNYAIDVTTDGDAFTVYAWLLDGSNRTIATHTEDSATSGHHVIEANVTITVGSVTLNGTSLTTQKSEIEVPSGS